MSKYVKIDNTLVKKLRTQKCWSQEELASASDLSIRTIQRIEKDGNASLETVKSLASVFEVEPTNLQNPKSIQHFAFSFVCKYAWLVAFAVSSIMFGSWIIDILIPTLKGADFNKQYEIHGNFRYLDYGGISFVVGFTMLGINVLVEHINKNSFLKLGKQ